jgi:hypothetical protein
MVFLLLLYVECYIHVYHIIIAKFRVWIVDLKNNDNCGVEEGCWNGDFKKCWRIHGRIALNKIHPSAWNSDSIPDKIPRMVCGRRFLGEEKPSTTPFLVTRGIIEGDHCFNENVPQDDIMSSLEANTVFYSGSLFFEAKPSRCGALVFLAQRAIGGKMRTL